MKPAPPMSPRKTGNASRTSGEGGWQPSPDVVALPTQVRRSVITADALPKVRAFHDQTFMRISPDSSVARNGSPTLDGRCRGWPPAHQPADRAGAGAEAKPDDANKDPGDDPARSEQRL